MSRRYLAKDQRALERELLLAIDRWPDWDGSNNIAYPQLAPVVLATPEGYVCKLMRFGLVPFSARGIPPSYSTTNAKAETLRTNPTWRSPWVRAQRCLVLASGFYESKLSPDGKTKQLYLMRVSDQDSFAMAGLWDRSPTEDGTVMYSFAIVTVHNDGKREPAILTREDRETWLSGTPQQARAALRPYPDDLLVATKSANDDAALIDPAVTTGRVQGAK